MLIIIVQNRHAYPSGTIQQIFANAKGGAGIAKSVGVHALRHCYATHLFENGIDISVIQKLPGNNDLKTTLRYLHVSNRHINAIENPLDALLRKHRKPEN